MESFGNNLEKAYTKGVVAPVLTVLGMLLLSGCCYARHVINRRNEELMDYEFDNPGAARPSSPLVDAVVFRASLLKDTLRKALCCGRARRAVAPEPGGGYPKYSGWDT
eukprot:2218626-Pyramimonas_sp.AAC.1